MITLQQGSRGPEVTSLQTWLNNYTPCSTDGDFGEKTRHAVGVAQGTLGLAVDGIVGPITRAKFADHGWAQSSDVQPLSPSSPYPDVPDYRALNQAQKVAKFGSPGSPASNPTPGGPIIVDQSFITRLVRIDLAEWFPQAQRKDFGVRKLDIHRATEMQWRMFFDAIVELGHGGAIISCAGSWAPRYVRGSTTTFSSHAFATAIDFNAPQNWLGAQPAKRGQKGSLVDVIETAKQFKIYSGIWFSRIDGMHLESTCTDEELGL